MSFLESKEKGKIPVGATVGGLPAFAFVGPTANGQVLVSDSSTVAGVKFDTLAAASVDPRDIMRFSMIHNVGVTGGG